MSRSLRRGALAAVLIVSIAPLAAACGAGSDSQTLQVKPNSVATSVGDIQVQNVYIVTEPSGQGAATVTARVFNNGKNPQQLTGINIQGVSGAVTLTAANGTSGPLTVPAGGAITLGGRNNPSAILADSAGVVTGSFQNTTFDFSSTGQVSLAPWVVPATSYFEPFGPSVVATPSATPTLTPLSVGPSAAPSDTASAAPGSASANPSQSAKH